MQALAHFPGQVEPVEFGILQLQFLDHAQALRVVPETAVACHQPVERLLAEMAEGRMAEIVRQRDRLGEVLVQAERAGQRPRDAGDLDGMGHPRPVMVARAVEEDLRLVLEPAEGAAVDDPVAVALEVEAEPVLVLRMDAAAGGGAGLRVGREMAGLTFLQIKTASRHGTKVVTLPPAIQLNRSAIGATRNKWRWQLHIGDCILRQDERIRGSTSDRPLFLSRSLGPVWPWRALPRQNLAPHQGGRR